jgi:phosphonate metabolism-associated iron-containing alcohol dehydrogenase
MKQDASPVAAATIGRFQNPVDVRIGRGCLGELPSLIARRRVAVMTTDGMQQRPLWTSLRALLPSAPLSVATVPPNPTFDAIEDARRLTSGAAQVIVALGGGSVIDAAKGVAFLSPDAAPGTLRMRLTGDGAIAPSRVTPIIAVPTTAGTGSEVTSWATVWEAGTGRKFSLAHDTLYPEAALIDPAVLDSLPFEQSLIPALDALSHACEAIWNRRANPIADGLAELAIRDLTAALSSSFTTSFADPDVRFQVQVASLRAGLAFSSTRTALAHSMSYPMTGLWGVPHGLACSVTLPELLAEAGRGNPDRVQPILRACGASDLTDGVAVLANLMRVSGSDAMMRRYIEPGRRPADLESLLVTPGRADNFIGAVTAHDARRLLERALTRVCS